MRILLSTINSKYIHQNLAVRLLYELNRHQNGLVWKEFFSKQPLDEITGYCSGFDLVAFSCYIWNITKILEVSARIKNLNPVCKILLGGPEVSYEWDDLINLKEIDFIITGEGEIPFSFFLNSYPELEKIPSLIWKKDGLVKENKSSGSFDLSQLKDINPYTREPEEELKNKICYIESSRGCPHCCDFCLAGLEKKVRYLPLETVYSNLLYLMQHGKIIKFLDRTFNTNVNFAISIFKFILENCQPGNIFQFEIKADILQPALIEYIQSNVPPGKFRFEIGIQTLNSKSNDAIRRKQNFENTRRFIEQVSSKIELHLDLIVGLPFDYYEDIRFSFEEVFKMFAPELQLGFLKFLKGTPVRQNSLIHGYLYNPLPPYQIIESKYLNKEELQKISILEHALEIYWNKKRCINTLKYISLNYSIFDFLLGLGQFFENKTGLHRYDLNEIYENIFIFSKKYFADNEVIIELIALDYYLQHKIKPGIHFLPEPDKTERAAIVKKFGLNREKFRYILHYIHFNPEKFIESNTFENIEKILIIQYDGVNKPVLIKP